ncbi:MAG: kelch repeat-containing protein, partial [Kangiellaceae bacterium]|nr:kelch repeat-containing protein [Kangiellaceae bacterium]
MAVARRSHYAGYFGHRLWVIGGLTSDNDTTNSTEIYDVYSNTWKNGPQLNRARSHLTGVTTWMGITVFGGRGRTGEYLNTI